MTHPPRLVLKNGDEADLAAFVTRVRAILEMLPELEPGLVEDRPAGDMDKFGFADVEFHSTYYGTIGGEPASPLTARIEISVEPGSDNMAELRIKAVTTQRLMETTIKEWIHADRSNALNPGCSTTDIADVLERLLDWASRGIVVIDDDNPTPERTALDNDNYAAADLAYALILAECSEEFAGSEPMFTLKADLPYRLPSLEVEAGMIGGFSDHPCLTPAGREIWAPFVPVQPLLVLYNHAGPTYLIRGNEEPLGSMREIPSAIDQMKLVKRMKEPSGPAVLPLPI